MEYKKIKGVYIHEDKTIEYDYLNVKGILQLADDLVCKHLKLKGSIQGKEHTIKIENEANVKGEVYLSCLESDYIKLFGMCSIKDIKVSELMFFTDEKDNNIESITADKVNILKNYAQEDSEQLKKLFSSIFGKDIELKKNKQGKSFIEKIVAKDVILEDCTVDFIECDNLTLKKSCIVKNLKISGILQIEDDSKVENRLS